MYATSLLAEQTGSALQLNIPNEIRYCFISSHQLGRLSVGNIYLIGVFYNVLLKFQLIFQGEVYKGFAHAYWAFSRSPLPQTLSLMADADEQQATEVFHLILTYAGLIVANKGILEFILHLNTNTGLRVGLGFTSFKGHFGACSYNMLHN